MRRHMRRLAAAGSVVAVLLTGCGSSDADVELGGTAAPSTTGLPPCPDGVRQPGDLSCYVEPGATTAATTLKPTTTAAKPTTTVKRTTTTREPTAKPTTTAAADTWVDQQATPDGQHYERILVRATYTGADVGDPASIAWSLRLGGTKGKLYEKAMIADGDNRLGLLDNHPEVLTGGRVEGWIWFMVDNDDANIFVINQGPDGVQYIDARPASA